MSSSKEIRELYGITQEELSYFLQIPASNIAMAETGQRMFSAAALLKLHQLRLAAEENTTLVITPTAFTEAMLKKIKQQLLLCERQLHTAGKKISIARKKNQQALLKQQLVLLMANNPSISDQEKTWMDLIALQAKKAIQAFGAPRQLLLALSIKTLQFKIATLQQLLIENERGLT